MGKQKRTRRESGLSLVELLGASVVAAVGLLSLAGVMVTTSHMREEAVMQRASVAATQNVLEQMRGTDPSSIMSTFGDRHMSVYNPGLETCGQMTVDTIVDDSVTGLISVTISTNYSYRGEERAIEMDGQVFYSPE